MFSRGQGSQADLKDKERAKLIENQYAQLSNQAAENPRAKVRIFRVPENWRKLRKEIFDPSFLSLGLFSELDPTHGPKSPTQFKVVVVKGLIKHVTNTLQLQFHGRVLDWKVLSERVVEMPRDMQAYYDLDENQQSTSEDTVRAVLAQDSLFVCGFLSGYLFREESIPRSLYDDIVSKGSPFFHQILMNDTVKLQNQVPLKLIQRVLAIIHGSEANETVTEQHLRKLCREWVLHHSESLPGFERDKFVGIDRNPGWKFERCAHLLECLCYCYVMVPTAPEPTGVNSVSVPNTKEIISLPSVSNLRKRGIHFRGISPGTGNVVPEFKRERRPFSKLRAYLRIPTFSTLQNTELVWRNMLAYLLEAPPEMSEAMGEVSNRSFNMAAEGATDCARAAAADFVCFFMFMSEMIETEDDVALLRDERHRVIQKNLLGTNKEVAELFNTIALQQTTPSTKYGEKWQQLRYEVDQFLSEQPQKTVLVESMRHYSRKPWLFISVIVSIGLLFYAVVQTALAILQLDYTIRLYNRHSFAGN